MLEDLEFVKAISHGWRVEEFVAAVLQAQGFEVLMDKRRIRPDRSSIHHYEDGGDIILLLPNHIARVEVKSHPYHFSSVKDMPKKYKGITVDESHKIDKKGAPPLLAYVTANPARTGGMVIWNVTEPDWYCADLYEQRQARYINFCLCPRPLVDWWWFYQPFTFSEEALHGLEKD